MKPELQRDLMAALERPHRLGTIGGDLEEQLAHCASFSSVLSQLHRSTGRGIDLGTGGGLPGVALAGSFPSMSWTLVDVRAARAAEVERTVLRLGYQERVTVIAAEAQHVGHDPEYREGFDVVVARAFGPPSITAECAAAVVRVGGSFVISEPPTNPHKEDSGVRWSAAGLALLGLTIPQFLVVDGYRFAIIEKIAPTPARVPRLPARPSRGWLTS